ncbi:MAG: tRNA (guanosine(46)-N7)-methyltransferase TrmB [Burkholderiales bacterium]|nr:tRNA (guanosine(46)-N7)-methyltransferase TrmB [Burkholderiales bacterium]
MSAPQGRPEAQQTPPDAARSIDTAAQPRESARNTESAALLLDAPLAQGPHPHIRSFSGRRGHFTVGQRQAYDTLRERWCIPFGQTPIDAAQIFGRTAPLIVEIGFGMGETTAHIAAAQPGHDFIGVEVYPAGVGALLARIDSDGLGNLRIVQHDAVEVMRDMIAPASLAGIHVYFSDPWPKKRHHKRRLIQSPFVALLASRLAPGGYLHCATDWEHYALQMLDVLSREPLLVNSAGPVAVTEEAATSSGFAPRPAWRPMTKFERRGVRLGHGVWDLLFVRR